MDEYKAVFRNLRTQRQQPRYVYEPQPPDLLAVAVALALVVAVGAGWLIWYVVG